MAGVFRSNVFDPVLVVSQITAMLCSFYGCLGLWLILANLIAGLRYSLDQFFDYHVSKTIGSYLAHRLML